MITVRAARLRAGAPRKNRSSVEGFRPGRPSSRATEPRAQSDVGDPGAAGEQEPDAFGPDCEVPPPRAAGHRCIVTAIAGHGDEAELAERGGEVDDVDVRRAGISEGRAHIAERGARPQQLDRLHAHGRQQDVHVALGIARRRTRRLRARRTAGAPSARSARPGEMVPVPGAGSASHVGRHAATPGAETAVRARAHTGQAGSGGHGSDEMLPSPAKSTIRYRPAAAGGVMPVR